MKNDQPNVKERAYVTVKVRKCNEQMDDIKCANDTIIEELLDQLVFTVYFTTGVAEMGNSKNYKLAELSSLLKVNSSEILIINLMAVLNKNDPKY